VGGAGADAEYIVKHLIRSRPVKKLVSETR
jgi:hypothetical protein